MIERTMAGALMTFLVCVPAACGAAGEIVPLPGELVGRWQTDAAAYADRYLELSAATVVIGTGAATSERYDLDRVVRTVDEEGILYTIHYSDDDGQRYDIGFYFDADDDEGATLRLRNQLGMAWRKAR